MSRLSAIALISCTAKTTPQSPFSLAIDSAPQYRLGVEDGDTVLEFSNLTSAAFFGENLAVANSGTASLRVLTPEGHLVRTIGRKGQGPGEFTGQPLYIAASADTLFAFDAGNRRVTTLSAQGAALRTSDLASVAAPAFSWISRLRPRTFIVQDEAPSLRACSDALLPKVAASHPDWPAIGVYIDQHGFFWTHRLPRSQTATIRWEVFDPSGTLVGQPSFSAGFTPLTIASDRLLGRDLDSLGVERLVGFGLRRGPEAAISCAPQAPTPAAPRPSPQATQALGAFGKLIGGQEAYYVEHGAYAATPEATLQALVPGYSLVVLEADKRHWFGLLLSQSDTTICAGGVGYQPPGWEEGVPRCQ